MAVYFSAMQKARRPACFLGHRDHDWSLNDCKRFKNRGSTNIMAQNESVTHTHVLGWTDKVWRFFSGALTHVWELLTFDLLVQLLFGSSWGLLYLLQGCSNHSISFEWWRCWKGREQTGSGCFAAMFTGGFRASTGPRGALRARPLLFSHMLQVRIPGARCLVD